MVTRMNGALKILPFLESLPLTRYFFLSVLFAGLIAGGLSGFRLLGIQLLAGLSISVWTAITSFITLKALDITIGLRVPLHEEILGADLVEHSLNGTYDKETSEWRDREGHLIMIVKQYDNESTKDLMARIESNSIRRCECLRSPRPELRSSMRRRRSAFGFSRSDDTVSHISDASDFIQEHMCYNKAIVEEVDGIHNSSEDDSKDNKKRDSQNHTSVVEKLRKAFGSVTSKRSDSYDVNSSPEHLPNGSTNMVQVQM